MNYITFRHLFVTATFSLATTGVFAADVEVKVEAKPKDAFIFVDGKPIGHDDKKLELTAGEHIVAVYNYGYVRQEQKIIVKTGDHPILKTSLERTGGPVQGPWGRLTIEEAHNRDAVFLNGKTAEFFIGHVDETNSRSFLRQKMFLPPGIHQVTIVDPQLGKEIFSGAVEIIANHETILNAGKRTTRFNLWMEGAKIESLPRFSSDATETTVAVAPVKGTFTADPVHINFGEPVQLTWSACDAVQSTISANGVPLDAIPLAGSETVNPTETTTYEFRTTGPGGTVSVQKTVHVNKVAQHSEAVMPAERRFHQTGDKVIERGDATRSLSTPNADPGRLGSIGAMNRAGNGTSLSGVLGNPNDSAVNETKTKEIIATDAYGRSMSLHITTSVASDTAKEPAELALPQTVLHCQ